MRPADPVSSRMCRTLRASAANARAPCADGQRARGHPEIARLRVQRCTRRHDCSRCRGAVTARSPSQPMLDAPGAAKHSHAAMQPCFPPVPMSQRRRQRLLGRLPRPRGLQRAARSRRESVGIGATDASRSVLSHSRCRVCLPPPPCVDGAISGSNRERRALRSSGRRTQDGRTAHAQINSRFRHWLWAGARGGVLLCCYCAVHDALNASLNARLNATAPAGWRVARW